MIFLSLVSVVTASVVSVSIPAPLSSPWRLVVRVGAESDDRVWHRGRVVDGAVVRVVGDDVGRKRQQCNSFWQQQQQQSPSSAPAGGPERPSGTGSPVPSSSASKLASFSIANLWFWSAGGAGAETEQQADLFVSLGKEAFVAITGAELNAHDCAWIEIDSDEREKVFDCRSAARRRSVLECPFANTVDGALAGLPTLAAGVRYDLTQPVFVCPVNPAYYFQLTRDGKFVARACTTAEACTDAFAIFDDGTWTRGADGSIAVSVNSQLFGTNAWKLDQLTVEIDRLVGFAATLAGLPPTPCCMIATGSGDARLTSPGLGLTRWKCDGMRYLAGVSYQNIYFEFFENGYVLRQKYTEIVARGGNTLGPESVHGIYEVGKDGVLRMVFCDLPTNPDSRLSARVLQGAIDIVEWANSPAEVSGNYKPCKAWCSTVTCG
jgi:hypothetical protein